MSRLGANQMKSEYVLLSLVVILGSALRIYGLDKSLWLDEVISVNRQRDIQSLVSHIDLPGKLYFIILHFFMIFGNDEVAARSPSVIFGVLSIYLIYKVGELFFGRPREGLIGAFLLSISTMHVWYSQEARYYSISMFLSLLSLFLFYKAIRENGKKLWVGFIISTILAVLSHWYMLFIPLIEMSFLAFILIKNRRSVIMRARKIGGKKIFLLVLGLMVAPISSIRLLQTALSLVETGWILRIEWGLKPESFFEDFFSYFSFGFSFSSLSNLCGRVMASSFLYFFLLFFLLGIFASIGKYRELTVFLLLWIFLPTMIVLILTLNFGSPITSAKYMIFILPGYLIVISRGISSIDASLIRCYCKIRYSFTSIPLVERKKGAILAIAMATILAFAGISVFPLQQYYKSGSPENWKAAADYLVTNARPDDIIVVEPRWIMECLLYYYEKNSSMAGPMNKITTSMDYFEDFKDVSSKYDKVWFVFSPPHTKYVNPKILDWMQRNFMEIRRFRGVSIYYHSEGLILVSKKNMSFIGLDSPPDERVARFWHNNDSATFNVEISKAATYTIAIHAISGAAGKSALELVIDGASKGIKTFVGNEWSHVELGRFYLDIGLHEIKVVSREGGDLGNTSIVFDQVVIWPNQ